MKLGQVGVGSNIAKKVTRPDYRKSYLAIIGLNSREKFIPNMKLGQVITCSNLVLSTPIWPQNTIFVHIYPYLPSCITIYLHLALFSLNYPYLVICSFKCPDLTKCAIITPTWYSSREIGQLFMKISHLNDLGDT